MRLRPLALTLTGVLCASVTALAVPTARADVTVTTENNSVPSSGTFQVEGHGWGHGHGMSQYGARGGAQLGHTGREIVGRYYPGTVEGHLANVAIRVRLLADNDNSTQIFRPPSPYTLTVTDLATGHSAALSTTPDYWRTTVDSAGLHIQQHVSSGWQPFAISGVTTFAGPVQYSGPPAIRLALPGGTSRDYRGSMRTVKLSSTTAATVNAVPMESYLRGVVPRESPSSWEQAALQAQAIAARSYSASVSKPSSYSDICDTTQCQVYGGAALYDSSSNKTSQEAASTDQAISATVGVIRTYNNTPIFAQFSASNGGWTTAGSTPYLTAFRDDWDGVPFSGSTSSNVHSWTATVTAAQIQSRYPQLGTLLRMDVTSRDGNGEWGGRVKTVVLHGRDSSGAATTVSTTGAGIYYAHQWTGGGSTGLRSSWWHVVPSLGSTIVTQSPAPLLVQNPGVSTGTMTVTLKNTGTTSWSTSGLHLTLAANPGQADPLVGNSTKPGTYTGTATSIAFGATAAFSFALTGDNVAPGTYSRSYRVRIGSGAPFGATVSWRIQVDAPTFVAHLVAGPSSSGAATNPSSGPPGPILADGRSVVVPVAGSQSLTYTLRNDSNVAWPVSSGGPVGLGTAAPLNRISNSSGPSWLVAGTRPSAVTASGASVAPEQNGTFGLQVYGNNQPVGATTEVFEPVWEHKKWITGADQTLTVVRVDPGTPRLATVHQGPPSKVSLTNAINGTTTLLIRLRNVGSASWTVGSERLAATSGALATPSWPSSTQAPSLARNLSRPAVSTVYPGEVGEWQVPLSAFKRAAGSYALSFRAASPTGVPYGPTLSTTVSVTQAVFTGSLVRTAGVVKVPSKGTATTWFDLKNTGNVVWPVGGKLRTESLVSSSPSYNATWLSATRPSALTLNVTRPGATDVRPGEVARFRFVLAGNGRTPRTTSESFGAVWDGWTRIGSSRTTLSYQVV